MYNLGLDNTPRIGFTLLKWRVKGLRRFERGDSRCKMAGAGFHSIAKFRAPIPNPVMADRGVYSADCHHENGHNLYKADCQDQA
jgi:hypothetical protein